MPEVAFVEFPPKKSASLVSVLSLAEANAVTHCSCQVAGRYHQRGRWYGQHSGQTLYFN